jgi:hypothetical protein
MMSSAELLPNLPIDALLGRSPGGLGGKKLRFRPQLFWQEILPEHAAAASLQFHCDMESGRNFARLPVGDTAAAASGGFARSVAVAVADGEVDAEEARLVARALREAATHEGPLMHLLSSCYCTRDALGPALLEAARHGNLENVQLLLHAGASAAAQPADENKTALHVACEAGVCLPMPMVEPCSALMR